MSSIKYCKFVLSNNVSYRDIYAKNAENMEFISIIKTIKIT